MTSKIIRAQVTTDTLEQLPLTEVAERLIYDETALNAVCERMIEAAAKILQRDLHQEDAWAQAERDLTPEQRFSSVARSNRQHHLAPSTQPSSNIAICFIFFINKGFNNDQTSHLHSHTRARAIRNLLRSSEARQPAKSN